MHAQAQIMASALGPSGSGDVPVSSDTLGSQAPTMRNLAFGSFWVQLPLSVVSACILFFAVQFTRAVRRCSSWQGSSPAKSARLEDCSSTRPARRPAGPATPPAARPT
jgi:hypothetical protein